MSVALFIQENRLGKWHANESAQQTSDVKLCRYGEWFSWSLSFFSPFSYLSVLFWFRICFAAGLSHQPPDVSRVQPLRRRHGQLPVELQIVSTGHGCTAGRGAAAQEQRTTVLDEFRPHSPPRLHELRRRLSPEGEWGQFTMSSFVFNKDFLVGSYLLLFLLCTSNVLAYFETVTGQWWINVQPVCAVG